MQGVIAARHDDAIASLDRMRPVAEHHLPLTLDYNNDIDRIPVMHFGAWSGMVRIAWRMVDSVEADMAWRQSEIGKGALPWRAGRGRTLIDREQLGEAKIGPPRL
jgi:hypothetical protein